MLAQSTGILFALAIPGAVCAPGLSPRDSALLSWLSYNEIALRHGVVISSHYGDQHTAVMHLPGDDSLAFAHGMVESPAKDQLEDFERIVSHCASQLRRMLA